MSHDAQTISTHVEGEEVQTNMWKLVDVAFLFS